MTLLRALFCLTFFILALPACAATAKTPLFGAQTTTLGNGLRVVVIPNHRAPVVTHMVWYKTGAAQEVFGKTGLAHFLEHLMFKGSAAIPPGEFSKRVRALGGTDNAFTTQDYTAYHQTIAAKHLETVMMMEADRMRGLTLPQAEFDSEKQVVLEERRQNTENDPRGHVYEQMRHALFPGHPYGTPVIGWERDIKGLTRDDALNWHTTWYAPNNAVLVIAGDTTLDRVKPLAEKIYGAIPARPVPDYIFPPVNDFPGRAEILYPSPRIHQTQLIRLYRVPGVVQDKGASLALALLEESLSGNATTRLYQSLVVDQKLATNAGLGSSTDVRDIGTLSIALTPADGVTLDALKSGLETELGKIRDHGITAAELQGARQRLIDSTAYALDSLTTPARIFGQALIIGETIDDIEYWVNDLEGVTLDQVNALAKSLFARTDYVTGIMMPAADPVPAAAGEQKP